MRRIVIVHRWDGAPEKDWVSWLARELVGAGFEVLVPRMPHPENPTIEDWVPFLTKTVDVPDENTFFIGHSIGCQTIMRYLATIDAKVGGAFFVAGWPGLKGLSELETKEEKKIANPWLTQPFDLAKTKNNLRFSIAILSDNDPFVPYQKTKGDFEKNLGAEVVTVSGGGHFTEGDGFTSFPLLAKVVREKIGDE